MGNESWGCGGNMRPEYYADLYRHYQTFLRNYGDNKLYKIAVGPSNDDYQWTDTLMKMAGKYMDALTLHYYTVPGNDWQHKAPPRSSPRRITTSPCARPTSWTR